LSSSPKTSPAHHFVSAKWSGTVMISIKIQCGCGQRYALDVKTDGDLAPGTVICPVCGVDGTAAANDAIAQSLSAQSTVAATPAGSPRMRVAAPPSSVPPATPAARGRPRPGQIEPDQAKHEARAKILWGDSPEAVIGYLLMQGFGRDEASDLVREMFRERMATVRATGIKKTVIGSGMVALPVVVTIIFLSIGVINLWIWATTIIVGVSGAWMALNGILMVLAPKSQAGDAADND
jgi:hypothetical protein